MSRPSQIPDRCWSHIGVWGDGSCEELKARVHCQNCEIFQTAGRQLLDREIDDDYKDRWTEVIGKKKETRDWSLSLTLFRISGEWFALPTRVLQEIAEPQQIRKVPHRREGELLGLVNIRGELILCISMASLLGLDDETTAEAVSPVVWPRLIVVGRTTERWTFPVDEIWGMWWIDPRVLEVVPITVAQDSQSFTRGVFSWRSRKIGLLDEELLFRSIRGRFE